MLLRFFTEHGDVIHLLYQLFHAGVSEYSKNKKEYNSTIRFHFYGSKYKETPHSSNIVEIVAKSGITSLSMLY